MAATRKAYTTEPQASAAGSPEDHCKGLGCSQAPDAGQNRCVPLCFPLCPNQLYINMHVPCPCYSPPCCPAERVGGCPPAVEELFNRATAACLPRHRRKKGGGTRDGQHSRAHVHKPPAHQQQQWRAAVADAPRCHAVGAVVCRSSGWSVGKQPHQQQQARE